jgi:hypothetical protein
MNKSESIGAIAKALSNAQKEITGARKDSKNPFFKSNYADLASIQEAITDALTSNSIAFSQFAGGDGINVTLETMLMHESGEWISGELTMKPAKNDPQGVGSCITYARRYGLAAICGVAQVDDDGNEATKSTTKDKPAKKVAKQKPLTTQQGENLNRLLVETDTDLQHLMDHMKIKTVDTDNFDAVMDKLENKFHTIQQNS